MKENLKSYQITLTVAGPVFVGSGKEISKKEYLLLQNKKVAILNIEKLYGLLTKKHLQHEYEKFMLFNQRETLQGWLRKNRISMSEVLEYKRYTLDNQDSVAEKGQTLHIMECMKDPYGNPYIPGSSVKGMLRTILLCDDIIRNPEKYKECRDMAKEELFSGNYRGYKPRRNEVLARVIKKTEQTCYNLLNRQDRKADAVNDIFSGVVISDSEPLDVKDLILCQKIDYLPDGSENKLNILRECVKPGTKIKFSLTIDTSICSLTENQIVQAIKNFSDLYYENFVKKFSNTDRLMPDTVFLGGGSGLVSKTVVYALFPGKEGIKTLQSIYEKTRVPEKHRHNKDLQFNVSPHVLKCTYWQGRRYQIGMCRCKIE